MHVFLNRTYVVRSAKNQRYNIFKIVKKKYKALLSVSSICKNGFSSMERTMSEK